MKENDTESLIGCAYFLGKVLLFSVHETIKLCKTGHSAHIKYMQS